MLIAHTRKDHKEEREREREREREKEEGKNGEEEEKKEKGDRRGEGESRQKGLFFFFFNIYWKSQKGGGAGSRRGRDLEAVCGELGNFCGGGGLFIFLGARIVHQETPLPCDTLPCDRKYLHYSNYSS